MATFAEIFLATSSFSLLVYNTMHIIAFAIVGQNIMSYILVHKFIIIFVYIIVSALQ